MISSRLQTEICEKFKIYALTEPLKCLISSVIEGSDVFVINYSFLAIVHHKPRHFSPNMGAAILLSVWMTTIYYG